jgi:hypothetical protein
MLKSSDSEIQAIRHKVATVYFTSHCLILKGIGDPQAQALVLERFKSQVTGLPFDEYRDELLNQITFELGEFIWNKGSNNVIAYLKCIHSDIAEEAEELQSRIGSSGKKEPPVEAVVEVAQK